MHTAKLYNDLHSKLRADPRWAAAHAALRARIAEVFAGLSDDDACAARQLIDLGGRTAICAAAIADSEPFTVGGFLHFVPSQAALEAEVQDLWNEAIRARMARKKGAA